MNCKPTCMYVAEKPGLLYSTEFFRAIDAALEHVDEVPTALVNLMLDALDIREYSLWHHNYKIYNKESRFDREKIEDFNNEHAFYLNVRTTLIKSSLQEPTYKQLKKAKEREAYAERKRIATIPGYDAELSLIYAASAKLNRGSKTKYNVDHIVPLFGHNKKGVHVVCGLHVPCNLSIILKDDNIKKGNRFDPLFYDDDAYFKENFKKNFTKQK